MPAREDYLIIVWDNKGGEPYPELFLSVSSETMQAKVSKLHPRCEYEVRRITDGYPARNVTDEFHPPFDEDAALERRPDIGAMMRASGAIGRP